MAWDDPIKPKTPPETSSPATLPAQEEQMADTGVSESAQRSGRITPNIGYDVIVQDEDTLSQGDRDAGPDGIIRNVQGKLNALGLDVGDVDGVIGRKTSGTIQEAQGKLGLPRTGVLDKKTQLALTTLSPDQIKFFKDNPESEAGYQNLGENVPVTTVKENVVDKTTAEPVEIEATEAVIEDQLDQDIPVIEMDKIIEPPKVLDDGERINESTSSGQVSGITKNYSLNGVERSIIDVSETTKSDPSLVYPAQPGAPPVDVQNVVLHYTGGLYKNGVRHYLNSFAKAASAAYLVDRSGQIYETFDPTVKGYHVAGSSRRNPRGLITNSNSIGVEVEASDTDLPTQAQLEATSWLSDYLIAQYGAQRVVAHPQANIHKGHVEGYDLVNYWRSQNNLPKLTPSNTALKNLFTLAPSVSPRPQARPNTLRAEANQ